MRILRTASTRRLLAAITGLLVAVVAGSAIAIAATGGLAVPPKKPLARAVHDALAGPAVSGISARITFANHLIDTGSFQGVDPLLTGASGRMWVAPGRGMRIELQSQTGNDAQIVVRHGSFWAYDPTSNTVYEGQIPANGRSDASKPGDARGGIPTVADIRTALSRLAGTLTVSGAIPGDVAGHPAYGVRLAPVDTSSLLDRVEVSWDAGNAVPLRFAVFAKGDSAAVLSLAASHISYGTIAASVFAMKPPSGAKVVTVTVPSTTGATHEGRSGKGAQPEVTGAAAVAKQVSFTLDAPTTAGGRALSQVRLIGHGAHAAALLAFGHGLGGVYVIERSAKGEKASAVTAPQGDKAGFTLPSVKVTGATAQELDTALGSVLTFVRSGVSYTVIGSVKPNTIKAVAQSL